MRKILFWGNPESYPIIGMDKYCAVVNVSDSPCLSLSDLPIKSFWFPVHETGKWGYSPFYGAAKVNDTLCTEQKSLIIHCHAGACRSPIIAYTILRAEGYTDAQIESINPAYKGYSEDLGINIARGCIPADIITFLQARHKNPTYSIMGLLMEIDSPNKILPNFKLRR